MIRLGKEKLGDNKKSFNSCQWPKYLVASSMLDIGRDLRLLLFLPFELCWLRLVSRVLKFDINDLHNIGRRPTSAVFLKKATSP